MRLADRGQDISATLAQTRIAIQQAGEASKQIGDLAQTTNGVLAHDIAPTIQNLNGAIASARQIGGDAERRDRRCAAGPPGLFEADHAGSEPPDPRPAHHRHRPVRRGGKRSTSRGRSSLIGAQKLPDYKGK